MPGFSTPRSTPPPFPNGLSRSVAMVRLGSSLLGRKLSRFASKVWKRKHRFIPTFDNDCCFLIDLLELSEESHYLFADEAALHSDARLALAASIRRECAHWGQRVKCR
ncbi:hypothetical protein D1007_18092 [Hordeum vulgare]|nr:hypothetical protein D1007_18092 [Hordeum vulgare]